MNLRCFSNIFIQFLRTAEAHTSPENTCAKRCIPKKGNDAMLGTEVGFASQHWSYWIDFLIFRDCWVPWSRRTSSNPMSSA